MVMRSLLLGAAFALAFTASAAQAQGLLERCHDDIEFYCNDVVPGDGRVLACLYGHSATLDDDCHAATDGLAMMLEGFFDTLFDANMACAPVLQAQCAKAGGGGATWACLQQHADILPDVCKATMARLQPLLVAGAE